MSSALVQQRELIPATRSFDRKLWFEWIFASVISETIGLGFIGIAQALFIVIAANNYNSSAAALTAFSIITLGLFKGACAGFAQGKVLRGTLPELRLPDWIAATTIGTVAALILAFAPGFLALAAEPPGNAQTIEITKFSPGASKPLMGFGLGLILGFSQWFVLRKYIKSAGFWIFANGLGWALGSALLFAFPTVVGHERPGWQIVLIIFAPIVAAAASVGAINGLFLVWLLKSKRES